MIEVRDVSKSFVSDDRVLKHISTEFHSGKINQIIGQSGSGKTVLLKCIVGLHTPDSGDILYDGRSFTAMTKKEKMQLCSEIGMLFQGSALFDSLTILENVLFPMRMFSDKNDKEQQNRARFCLERVGLNNVFDLYPSELSGGMQKRAAIARAISLNPKYLFCDEPNSGLDPLSAITIDELIVELTKEFQMTTIINTHDLNSVLSVGEQIVFIYKGVKAWEGPKEKIFVSECPELNEFIFASEMFQKFKTNLVSEQSGQR